MSTPASSTTMIAESAIAFPQIEFGRAADGILVARVADTAFAMLPVRDGRHYLATGWRIGRVSLIVDKPVWNDTVLDDRLIAKADHAEAHLIDLPELHDAKAGLAGLGQYVEIDNLNAPGVQVNAAKVTFEGDIDKLPDDIRTYGEADLVKRWQAAGGTFTLKGFKGTDGDSHFEATGALSLDAQGRVNGQVKLNSKGVVERLGTAIPEQYKGLIVGSPAADGSYSQTVNIAAGLMFVGLVPAGMLPPVF